MQRFAKSRGTVETGTPISKVATESGEINLTVSNHRAHELINKDLIAAKNEISAKKIQLGELKNKPKPTDATELAAHQKEIADLESSIKTSETTLSFKLAAEGLDANDVNQIMSNNFKLTKGGWRNPKEGWNPFSGWRSAKDPNAVKVLGEQKLDRVLKEGDISWYDQYARNFARKQGYVTAADYEAGNFRNYGSGIQKSKQDIDKADSDIKMNDASIEANLKKISNSEKAINGIDGSNSKLTKVASEINTVKGEDAKILKAIKDQRTELTDLATKVNDSQVNLTTAQNDLAAIPAGNKIQLNIARKAVRARIDAAQKEFDTHTANYNDAQQNLTDLTISRNKLKLDLNKLKRKEIGLNKTITRAKTDLNTATADNKTLTTNNETLAADRAVSSDKLRGLRQELSTDYNNYSRFRTFNKNNNLLTGSIAGAGLAAVTIANITNKVSSDAEKVNELSRLDRFSLEEYKRSIQQMIKANPGNNEYLRQLNLIERALNAQSGFNKDGGKIKKFEDGGYTTLGKSNPISIKDVTGNFIDDITSPSNLKFANTFWTNSKLNDQIKKLSKPQAIVAPTTTKLKTTGMTDAMNRYNRIGQNQNASQYSSSDAKLNSAQRIAKNEQVLDAYGQIGSELSRQNQAVDAENASLFSQDAANRANISAQNAMQDHQYQTMQNQYTQGLIRSNGQSIDNLLSEKQHKQEAASEKLMALDLQSEQDRLNKIYEPKLNEVQNKYTSEATAKGMGLQEYLIANPLVKAQYEKEMNVHRDARKEQLNDFYRKMYTNKYASGGSLEEKKELIRYKEEMKRVADKDKAFNKMMLDKMNSHQKMLSLLLKK